MLDLRRVRITEVFSRKIFKGPESFVGFRRSSNRMSCNLTELTAVQTRPVALITGLSCRLWLLIVGSH